MISGPLGLVSRLNPPPRDLDVLHWISVGGACLLFIVAGSRFVLEPGLLVVAEGRDFTLPQLGQGAQHARTAPVVLGYRRDNVLLFQDGIYRRLVDLRAPLRDYAAAHPGAVLLVLADRQVSFQALSELAQLAVECGLGGVHVAGQSRAVADPAASPTRR
jgi:biopolymer transport protein ExbD